MHSTVVNICVLVHALYEVILIAGEGLEEGVGVLFQVQAGILPGIPVLELKPCFALQGPARNWARDFHCEH